MDTKDVRCYFKLCIIVVVIVALSNPVLAECTTKCGLCPVRVKSCKVERVRICNKILQKYDKNHDNFIELNEIPPPGTPFGYLVFIAYLHHIPVCQIRKETKCQWVTVGQKECNCRKICNLPPTIKILQPRNGQKFVAASSVRVPIRVKAMDNQGLKEVAVYLDGRKLASNKNHFFVALTPGKHTITAVAVNKIGKKASESITVYVVKDSGPELAVLQNSSTFVYIGRGNLLLTVLAKSKYGVRMLKAFLANKLVASKVCNSDVCVLNVRVPVRTPTYTRFSVVAVDTFGAKTEKTWFIRVTNNLKTMGTYIQSSQEVKLGNSVICIKEVGSTILVNGTNNLKLLVNGKEYGLRNGKVSLPLAPGVYKVELFNGKASKKINLIIPSPSEYWILTTKNVQPHPKLGGECFAFAGNYYCNGGRYRIIAVNGAGCAKWDRLLAGSFVRKTAIGGQVYITVHRFGLDTGKRITIDLSIKTDFWRMDKVPPHPVALSSKIYVNGKLVKSDLLWFMKRLDKDFLVDVPITGSKLKVVVGLNFFGVYRQFTAEFYLVPDNPELYLPKPPEVRYYKLINTASWVLIGYHPKRFVSGEIQLDGGTYRVNTTAIVTPFKPGNPDYSKPCLRDSGLLYLSGKVLIDGRKPEIEKAYYPVWNGERDVVRSTPLEVVPKGWHTVSEIVESGDVVKNFYAHIKVYSPVKDFNLSVKAPESIPLYQKDFLMSVHIVPGTYLGYKWCPEAYGDFYVKSRSTPPHKLSDICQLIWKIPEKIPNISGEKKTITVRVCSDSGICRSKIIKVARSMEFIKNTNVEFRVKVKKGYYPVKSVYLDPLKGDACIIGKVDRILKKYGAAVGFAYFSLRLDKSGEYRLIAVDTAGDADTVFLTILTSKPVETCEKLECGQAKYLLAYVPKKSENVQLPSVTVPVQTVTPREQIKRCLTITDLRLPKECVEAGKRVLIFFTVHSYCGELEKAELFVNGKLVAIKSLEGRTESVGMDYVPERSLDKIKVVVFDSNGDTAVSAGTVRVCSPCTIELNVKAPKVCLPQGVCLIRGIGYEAKASNKRCAIEEVRMYVNGKLLETRLYDNKTSVSGNFEICSPPNKKPGESSVVRVVAVGANGYSVSRYLVFRECLCTKYTELYIVPSHHSSPIFVKTSNGYYEIGILTHQGRFIWLNRPTPAPDYLHPIQWFCTYSSRYRIYIENQGNPSIVGKIVCGDSSIATVPSRIMGWIKYYAEVEGVCK